MPQQQNAQLSNREGRIQLALSAYNQRQFQSRRLAAEAFRVPLATLARRYNGIPHRLDTRNARHKLTATEEQTIVQYILDLDSRGFAPRLCEVADIADKLLAVRGGEPVGKC
jgi:hypothetical protein